LPPGNGKLAPWTSSTPCAARASRNSPCPAWSARCTSACRSCRRRSALTTALNLALDRILPRATLEPLTGKLVCLRVTDGGLTLLFTLTPKRASARPSAAVKPDLMISARARDFIALAIREEDPDTLFFNRRLVMEGDTDLGLLVKNTLDAVDWPRLEPEDLHPFRLLALLRLRMGPSSH
jgi:predicted lipid carrier protein YhbT